MRLAEHLIEYFNNEGVAVNAVNVPAATEEAYLRQQAPTPRWRNAPGIFAAHVATANPKLARLVYHGNFPRKTPA